MKAAILCAKFSPYHAARLERTAELGKMQGNSLHAIELAGIQSEYGWAPVDDSTSYEKSILFPDSEYSEISSRGMKASLYAALNNIQPDVVFLPGWSPVEANAAFLWTLRHGISRVLISDSHGIGRTEDPVSRFLKRLFVSHCDAALVGGTPQIRYLSTLGFPQTRCFPGCDVVDNEMFLGGSDRSEGSGDVVRFLTCARLIPEKNLTDTLSTLAALQIPWSWKIVGDGPEKDRVLSEIRRLQLGDRVTLIGHVPYHRLPEHYSAAYVYLQPSISETWGLSVNEAMASGLPVIVSDRCGCHEDLVRHGQNGFLFDPAEPQSLFSAATNMFEFRSRWKAMGEASRRLISDWGLDLFAENFWQAFQTAVGHSSKKSDDSMMGSALRLFS